jgi:Na+/H+ antiporter NhaC
VKLLVILASVAFLAAATYYRFVRHIAVAYYLLFGGWIVTLAIYEFRYGKKSAKASVPKSFGHSQNSLLKN